MPSNMYFRIYFSNLRISSPAPLLNGDKYVFLELAKRNTCQCLIFHFLAGKYRMSEILSSTIHNIQPHCWNSQISSVQFHTIFEEKKTFSISWLSLEPGFINHMLAQLCITKWWSCVLGQYRSAMSIKSPLKTAKWIIFDSWTLLPPATVEVWRCYVA